MADVMHWARWGNPTHMTNIPASAWQLIELAFGETRETPAVDKSTLAVPPISLTDAAMVSLRQIVGSDNVTTDNDSRISHTRGKSTTDLIKIRTGDLTDAPDAVVRPRDTDDVAAILAVCAEHTIAVVPYGGGTSVVGGLAAQSDGYTGVVALDLTHLNTFAVDHESRLATLGAGLLAPQAEKLLNEHGYTLGHFPQSFEYASIGGFAATRSSGQASSGYGRFDSMVKALTVVTPMGVLRLDAAPASAAGPDLRQLILGSEGAFGIITDVTIAVRPQPAQRIYETWRFATFADGTRAMRKLTQDGLNPTVFRLSDEAETAINLAKPGSIGADNPGGCLMVAGYEGTPERVSRLHDDVTAALEESGGTSLGAEDGEHWAKGRYDGPYLRDALLDHGILTETLETATFWSRLHTTYVAVKEAIEAALAPYGNAVIVMCHISHVYESGASLYFTVVTKQHEDGIEQWSAAKKAASDAMIATGATITHHHAIGRDHKPWFAQEIGDIGVSVLRAVKQRIDPTGILNPGVLIP
ncbi:FAD-binding oxidoreductase [Hoyosella rhizosphaerae]|uniref:Alkyldihydroxyacetonephosphate synthase n=1 Tax=Hoyosella rhizosphaerae TaxID=1755582 RepID=A0A916U5L4_9ACTN|nr:FAD-binding oxidoreductase [Hoyosella rhizosphaerae]MBN4926270.1 FAD-binding oxidoreductase [Hoyosella rhizosphaerae]GGC60726.1 alkyldihydroxyacetonephosphate synthase [Hoyosella rhizosphaerae]